MEHLRHRLLTATPVPDSADVQETVRAPQAPVRVVTVRDENAKRDADALRRRVSELEKALSERDTARAQQPEQPQHRGGDPVAEPEAALPVVRCVEVANVICTLKGISSVGLNLVAFCAETIGVLGFTKDDIVVLSGDLDRQLESSASILQV